MEEDMGLLAKSLFGESHSLISAELLETLLADYPRRDFQVRLWDGTTWGMEKQPRFTLVLKHPGALRAMFLSPSELKLGEAYIYDDFNIEGDIEAAFDLADYLLGQERSLGESVDLNGRLQKLPAKDRPRAGPHPIRLWGSVHSKDRDQQAVAYHYDLPADFEHVGEALLPEYFNRAYELLRPGGVFLNHGIAYSATYRRKGPSFSDRYVFPDGELVPINTTLRAAELSGFEVRDLESLREQYALTLHKWVQRLEAHGEEARRITDDKTYRIWRLYMAGSAHGFRTGRLNVYQTLLAKPRHGDSGLPLTREDWYRV
jgi:hypothetical protein